MSVIEVKVPDIGDFDAVELIEVLVKPGDTVEQEQSLIVLESDKASMEVPSPVAGKVVDVRVKVGDKVGQGTVICTVEAQAAAAPAPPPRPPRHPHRLQPRRSSRTGSGSREPQRWRRHPVRHAGSGRGSRRLLGSLPRRRPGHEHRAGGTLRHAWRRVPERRCIPSKALLHNAAVIDEAKALAAHGILFGEAKIDLDGLRHYKNQVVGKLTGGLAGMAKARKVQVVRGIGTFLDPHHMEVEVTEGEGKQGTGKKTVIRFEKAVIAAGSQAVKLPFIPEDPRIVDSTGALELPEVPNKMLVIGGGIIGLEMATVYSTLGADIDVVEMLPGLMNGADRDLVKVWEKKNKDRFGKVMLNTKTVGVEAKPDGIYVKFEGEQAPAEPQRYDLVLVSVGRSPNGKRIGAEKAGVAVTDRGFINVDSQMRTNVPHIFAIGDVVGQPMLAHKAVHEAHVAAEAAHGEKAYFDAKQIPSVAFTDPEVAWAGLTEDQCKEQGIKYSKGVFPWAASGRAIANGRDEGFTKLIFDEETHRIIGGGIVGTHAGDLISEVCLAIEMGADAVDIGKTIHPHPTLGESIGMAAEIYEGTCTDVPPPRKR